MLSALTRVAASLCFISVIWSSAAWSEVHSLKACGHQDYPPWNWRSGDQIIGACAEVTKTLFQRLGVAVDLSYIGPWKRCQQQVEMGNVDVNICAFINETRQKYSRFTKVPMGYNQNAVFVKKGQEFKFQDWSDLEGKSAAMVLGVSIGQDFDMFLNDEVKVDRVSDFRSGFEMLNYDRVDFLPTGRESGYAMLEAFGFAEEIAALPEPITTGNLYISMSSKSAGLDLLPQIEAMMQAPGYAHWVESLLQKYRAIYAQESQL